MKLACAILLLVLSALSHAQKTPSAAYQGLLDVAEPGAFVEMSAGYAYVEIDRLIIRKPVTVRFSATITVRRVRIETEGFVCLIGLRTPTMPEPWDSVGIAYNGPGANVRLEDCEIQGPIYMGGNSYLEAIRSTAYIPNWPFWCPWVLDMVDGTLVSIDSQIASLCNMGAIASRILVIPRPPAYYDGWAPVIGFMEDDLHVSGAFVPGGTLTASWQLYGPMGLFVQEGFRRPTQIGLGGHGVAFITGQATLLAIGGATGSATWRLPASASIIGTGVTLQAVEASGRLSRPQIGTVHPRH